MEPRAPAPYSILILELSYTRQSDDSIYPIAILLSHLQDLYNIIYSSLHNRDKGVGNIDQGEGVGRRGGSITALE